MGSRDAEIPTTAPDPAAPVRILHCEYTPSDAALVERLLRRWQPLVDYHRVADESEYRGALRDSAPDLVPYGYTVPGFGGPAALRIAREQSATLPFIFLSATIGEHNAIESLKQGATDYVVRDAAEAHAVSSDRNRRTAVGRCWLDRNTHPLSHTEHAASDR